MTQKDFIYLKNKNQIKKFCIKKKTFLNLRKILKKMNLDFFKEWCEKKKKISEKNSELFFHEREIWWCYFGKNIGYEANGKKENFSRPGLIFKKINNHTCYILPLTSQNKENIDGYIKIPSFEEGKDSYGNLMQIRVFDKKRLFKKVGKIKKNNFLEIIKKVKEFLF